MAIKPKQILDTAVGLGKGVVSAAGRRLRGGARETDSAPSTPGSPAAETSGAPTTVGAPKPGEPRGHKSATAPKAPKPSKAKPAKRAKATRAAATSGKDVADAASGKDD